MHKTKVSLSLIMAIGLLFPQISMACTNFLITKNASADNSTMISYAADSHDLYGELYYWPGQTWPDDAMLDVYEWDTGKYLGQIKQAKKTYTVIGNINENQVAIAETTFGGRKELVDTSGIIDYGSLIYIALQRSRSAREAIKIMTDLVAEYGYYSSGESFSIADKNEVWIMEMIGKGTGNKGAVWVARKIPNGMVSGHANQARITTFPLNDEENCLYADDVIDFAKEQGYFDGKKKDFSFADSYAPLDYGALRFCEARVWSGFRLMNPEMDKFEGYIKGESSERLPLWIKPSKKISYRDVQNIMRDHFEGTSLDMTKDAGAGSFARPYRFRPLTWKVDDQEYFNERAIATQQTGFSFVAQLRDWLPDAIGGILWFGVDDAATSVYVPIYCGINAIPHHFAVGNGSLLEYSSTSAFWIFNRVSNQAYSRYSHMIQDIKKVQKGLEDKFEDYAPVIEQAAVNLNKLDPQKAKAFITEYSLAQSKITFDAWKKLDEFLMVKYLDGNLHKEENGVFLRNKHGRPYPAQFPGYSKEFYEKIVKETGDKLKMKKLPREKSNH
ncbi:dipeptidase [Saccharicrinis fermentans]|uniref:Dipeptidase n=1 Tax=Saccharicrinis fermentans DSM 9555 = JCM 21142 TaxID=869213 RepID=W7Y5I2_9BACT|nr:C69 family dipeptidase [Saccharicrinis fermentans]GAF03357.1 dipeptidase [Saccharicrinis fermentans DSM 9555 = JCM 21142]